MMKILIMALCVLAVVNVAAATTIRGIDFDFVIIDDANNAPDTNGYGAVGYNYYISKYEITNGQWNTFVSFAGAPTGNPSYAYDSSAYYTGDQQPTNYVSWYEAAQFCNYLTSGDKSRGVYQFSGNNVNPSDFLGIDRAAAEATYGTIYFLPTEDEWYKAAYYKPDSNDYSLYANGTDTAPLTSDTCYGQSTPYTGPWNVGTGTEEQNGTYDMMGNVWEWNETLINSVRGIRGGAFYTGDNTLASSYRDLISSPDYENDAIGFRVASNTCDFLMAGDLNDDCKVDLLDFAIMATNWLRNCKTDPADPACIPKTSQTD